MSATVVDEADAADEAADVVEEAPVLVDVAMVEDTPVLAVAELDPGEAAELVDAAAALDPEDVPLVREAEELAAEELDAAALLATALAALPVGLAVEAEIVVEGAPRVT